MFTTNAFNWTLGRAINLSKNLDHLSPSLNSISNQNSIRRIKITDVSPSSVFCGIHTFHFNLTKFSFSYVLDALWIRVSRRIFFGWLFWILEKHSKQMICQWWYHPREEYFSFMTEAISLPTDLSSNVPWLIWLIEKNKKN